MKTTDWTISANLCFSSGFLLTKPSPSIPSVPISKIGLSIKALVLCCCKGFQDLFSSVIGLLPFCNGANILTGSYELLISVWFFSSGDKASLSPTGLLYVITFLTRLSPLDATSAIFAP